MTKEKSLKKISILLALVFINQILFPSAMLAVTGGPGQPELESFTPFNSSNMVDPFSGDFSYNIPLLNVPGPNGGYPINIAYSGNVGTEQEAGWVGLGWSLNPGAINRQLRGLPDDFDGTQKVTRERKMKPNRTYTLGLGTAFSELLGFDFSKFAEINGNVSLSVNNYNGFNMDVGAGFALAENQATEGSNDTKQDDQTGEDTEKTKKSFAKRMLDLLEEEKTEENLIAKGQLKKHTKNMLRSGIKSSIKNIPSAAFFAGSGDNLSSIDFPRTSNSFTFDGKLGATPFGAATLDLEFTLFYSQQNYSESSISYPAYGYMNSQSGSSQDDAVMDYYTDKNSTLTSTSAFLPVPILTNDVFSVTGQGVGGVYRPQLGTIPMLSKPIVESSSNAYGFGADYDFGGGFKGGVNPKATFTKSYSGNWSSGDNPILWFTQGLGLTSEESATFEQNTFIKLGDLTDNQWHNSNILEDAIPLRFDLKTEFHGLSWKPKAVSQLYKNAGGSFTISKPDHIRKERAARSNLFKYFTTNQLQNFHGGNTTYRQIEEASSSLTVGSSISTTTVNQQLSTSAKEASLIQQVEIENNDVNYVYGIPVFTHSKVDKTFSVDAPTLVSSTKGSINVGTDDDTQDNENGRAAMYNSNTVDKFAHAYLLTEILSGDYVDITQNGPSADDFGSYTQFGYTRLHNNFVSRSPAHTTSQEKASYMPGVYSDKEDDMGTYSETDKEIYYLNKIETKTHYAEFELEVRGDDFARDPSSGNNQYLAKLKRITLYKKDGSSTGTEIKSVEFEYNDDESTAGVMQGAPGTSNGKLTLKRIRFTFEGQKTDSYLNPYEFDYYNTGVNYSEGDMDKWGKYQPDSYNEFDNNFMYPYVAQNRDLDDDGTVDATDTDLRNTWASAWRLKTITLPTGGEVEVKYESDDYGYVQNKNAQDMYEVVGINSPDEWELNSNKIYFKLKEAISTTGSGAVADQLEEDLDNIYFKMLIKLKDKPSQYDADGSFVDGGDVAEFVEGYLDNPNVGFDNDCLDSEGLYQYAYVTVDNASLSRNPMRVAAANYLRLQGGNLNHAFNFSFTGAQTPSKLINIVVDILTQASNDKDLMTQFVGTVLSKNWCNEISQNLPSIVRLNAQDNLKYGGGSRVSEIVIKDNWNTMQSAESTFNMKQVYTYETEDGKTSGVAEYEPLTGGEENPLRQPYHYSSQKGFVKNNALLFELPATEALYPSASVGYSRVVVENIPINTDGTDISEYSLSSNGVMVNEFYTAKDYPVISTATRPKKVNLNNSTEFAKWFGGKSFFHPGFTQGYYTELNDMHGKQKRMSTYSATLGTDEAPFQSTSYYYKTINGYSEGARNQLNNEIDVLTNDGAIETKTIGQVSDAWVEIDENETETKGGDIKFNLSLVTYVAGIPIPIPTALPIIDYSHRMRRTLVLNKLSSKSGILDRVVTQQEGRTTIVNNLLFDYENGQPLLTQVLNDFDAPIYSYNRPQHWVNDNFKHPWRNWGATVSSTEWEGIIQNGDLIIASSGEKYWVEDAETGALKDENGTALNAGTLDFPGGTIIQSGYTGRSGAMSSQLVSLNDPSLLTNRSFLLFTSYNDKGNWLNGLQADINRGSVTSAVDYYNCDNNPMEDCSLPSGPSNDFCPQVRTEASTIFFYDPVKSTSQSAYIEFPDEYEDEMGDFTLEKIGSLVRATLGSVELILAWNDPYNLFPECIPGMLDAGVTLYDDTDIKDHSVLNNGNYSITQSDIDDNLTRYRDLHDYRVTQSLKNINRRGYTDDSQTAGFFESHLDEDGSYAFYVDYNFTAEPNDNTDWTNQGQISLYDPFGNTIETENALGIHSSEIFNEDHTLVTATSVNAEYGEISYHNFEDLSGSLSGTEHGNLTITSATVNTSAAHTGDQSLSVSTSSSITADGLLSGERYRISFWQQSTSNHTPISAGPTHSNANTTYTVDAKNIDNWDLVTYTFEATSSSASIGFSSSGVLDDIRIYPADASIKTFVYDLNTYRLIAELDANNFATLYGYSEEGTLSQVKKETNRGIQTVSNYIVHRKK